jgi:CheY-like chemotaxis protein
MLDPTAGMVSGDAARIGQILSNLLTNAIKFTPRRGHVEVRLKRQDSTVVISVSDTGEGINPEFLEHLFDRFRQAEGSTTRQHTSLGLGLAIVRHLVEAHGGTVSATSKGIGQGATFTVTLPLLAVSRIDSNTEQAYASRWTSDLPSSAILEGLRVLIVDDQLDARELLTLALKQSGSEVRTSASAREALDLMDQWSPDVIVSDIGMPGEDGYELMRRVRARQPEHGGLVPALAVTGYGSPEDATRARAVGYQLHMAKPVAPDELVAMVASLIIKTRTTTQLSSSA